MSGANHRSVYRPPHVYTRPTVGIFVSEAIVPFLPLYCRSVALAQARIAALFRNYCVIHNRVYAPTEVMGSNPVDLVVLVTVNFPERLVARIPGKTLVIAVDDGDISLYDVVRSRSMHALAETLEKGRWVRVAQAEQKYSDPLPFTTACAIAIRLGHVSRKNNVLLLR